MKRIDHDAPTIFLRSNLAGWLIGVMSWLVSAGRDTTSQVLFVWPIAMTIGLGRLRPRYSEMVSRVAQWDAGPGASRFGRSVRSQ
jgi:formate-nitrite transporter family protein